MEMYTRELPVLRDNLAVHRTALANERTMLAYLRTALTLFAAGVTFVKFFEHPAIVAIGWALIPVSAVTLIKGVASYRRMLLEIIADEKRVMDEKAGG